MACGCWAAGCAGGATPRPIEQHAATLEADREALARDAVAAERARIARETHDAVAHSVSVMVLQAGAAEQVLTTSPERARASLAAIQDTGREAIVELRRTLGLLRDPHEIAPLGPQPGMEGDSADTRAGRLRDSSLPRRITTTATALVRASHQAAESGSRG